MIDEKSLEKIATSLGIRPGEWVGGGAFGALPLLAFGGGHGAGASEGDGVVEGGDESIELACGHSAVTAGEFRLEEFFGHSGFHLRQYNVRKGRGSSTMPTRGFCGSGRWRG